MTEPYATRDDRSISASETGGQENDGIAKLSAVGTGECSINDVAKAALTV